MRRDDQDPTSDALQRERLLVAAAREQSARVRARSAAHRTDHEFGLAGDDPRSSVLHDRMAELQAHLPGYELEREIHRGGQGVVYQALQKSTGRQVAIKVMKEGPFAGADDKARFDREVRILAQLDHPSIVAIHDSGTSGGCFYSVMNYIAGRSLDVYIRENEPSLEKMLKLFVTICEAVNAAHLRGIVHRDLKPSNIRVDADGQPHVLDFGLARVEEGAAVPGGSIAPAMTQTGQFVGSLPWASPEQAAGIAGGIDVRSDVYSLGVVLYQMLTGTFPYDVRGGMFEVVQRIVHAEPVKPSVAGTYGAARIRVNDEVETIVLKCLSKDPDRRYQNAGELGRDIRHYLAGEPIEARRDSLGYAVRKALRRNRGAAITTVVIAALLMTGAVFSAFSWQRAEREASAARAEAAKAARINSFLKELLTLADPARTMGVQLTVREALEGAAKRIEAGSLQSEPLVEADVRATIGATFLSLSMYEEAEAQLAAAEAILARELGDDHADVLRARSRLVEVYRWHGDHAAAVKLARPTLERQLRVLGEDHPETLRTLSLLGTALTFGGKCGEAEPYLRRALAGQTRVLGPEHPDTTESMTELANLLLRTDRPAESEQIERAALAIMTRTLGPEDPKTLSCMRRLGATLIRLGQLVEGEVLLRRALDGLRQVFGDEHASTANCKYNLGKALREAGKSEEAGFLIGEAFETYRRLYGPGNKWTIAMQNGFGSDLISRGRVAEAIEIQADALDQARRSLGDDDFETHYAVYYYSRALGSVGRYAEAEQNARAAFESVRRNFVAEPEMHSVFALMLATLLDEQGKHAEARAVFEENVEACRQAFGAADARTFSAMDSLGSSLFARGMRSGAEPLCRAAVTGLCATDKLDPARLIVAFEHLAQVLDQPGRLVEAEAIGAETVRRVRADLASGHWAIGVLLTHHARALVAMKRFAQAETELNEAYGVLVAARGPTEARTRTAIRAMAELYDAWHAAEPDKGHDVEAREWAAKLGVAGGMK